MLHQPASKDRRPPLVVGFLMTIALSLALWAAIILLILA